MANATKSLGGAYLFSPVSLLLWPVAKLLFRPRVLGRRHVPRGGVVLAANHLSGFDPLAMAFPLVPRRLRNMGKNQLFRRRILGPVVRSLGAFPAHDGPDGLGGVPAAAALARAGQAVAIFPEGARRRKGLHRPRTGAAVCALEAEVPLVPVALRGTDGWRRLARWGIAFGPAVPLDDLRGQDQRDAAREATDRLWRAVSSLELVLADRK